MNSGSPHSPVAVKLSPLGGNVPSTAHPVTEHCSWIITPSIYIQGMPLGNSIQGIVYLGVKMLDSLWGRQG